jgi:hypothetical protein
MAPFLWPLNIFDQRYDRAFEEFYHFMWLKQAKISVHDLEASLTRLLGGTFTSCWTTMLGICPVVHLGLALLVEQAAIEQLFEELLLSEQAKKVLL